MTLGSLLLGIALLLAVGLFIVRPFLSAQSKDKRLSSMSRQDALETQKEAILEQIRALDFDHETGKVPDEEHGQLRGQLLSEAARILQQLDELAPASNGDRARVDVDIEAAIAKYRARPAPASGVEDDIEAAVLQHRQQAVVDAQTERPPSGPGANFCSQCGQPRDRDDRFCAFCGHRFV